MILVAVQVLPEQSAAQRLSRHRVISPLYFLLARTCYWIRCRGVAAVHEEKFDAVIMALAGADLGMRPATRRLGERHSRMRGHRPT